MLKADRRDQKKASKRKMRVSGKSVKVLQQILGKRAEKARA